MRKHEQKIVNLYRRAWEHLKKSGLPLVVSLTQLAKRAGVSVSLVSRTIAEARRRGEVE